MEQAPSSLLGGALFYTQPSQPLSQPTHMLHQLPMPITHSNTNDKYNTGNYKSSTFWKVDSSFISTPSDDGNDDGDDDGDICNDSSNNNDDVFTTLLSVTPTSPSPSPLTSSSSSLLTKL